MREDLRSYPRTVAWMPLLKLVSPASAYMRRMEEEEDDRRRARRGMTYGRGRGWAVYGPPGGEPPPDIRPPAPTRHQAPQGPSRWAERHHELEAAHREELERGAEELLRTGEATISTPEGPLHTRLVRFWNGTAVLDSELPGAKGSRGRAFTLLERRELKRGPARLAQHLMTEILSLDRKTHPDLWGPPPPEPERVASPGGWTPPPSRRPGWNWVPPGGAVPRPDLMPGWVRFAYHTPFVDRFAFEWMWDHGGWEVAPPAASE